MPNEYPKADDLLRPREVTELFGVRTSTIARSAREGKLTPLRTPGGTAGPASAGYSATPSEAEQQLAEDAARLYGQGWNIRQVAGKNRLQLVPHPRQSPDTAEPWRALSRGRYLSARWRLKA